MTELKFNQLYPAYPLRITIPGGAKANIFVTEGPVKQPDDSILILPILVQCNIGRVGTRMAGYGIAISRLCTALITHTSLDECIGILSVLSLDLAELEAEVDESSARSLPEAFAIALRSYRSLKQSNSTLKP
jgi:hypothetical protein